MNFVIHVSTLVTNDQNQILLVKEKKEAIFNKLNLPGGHLEFGEALIQGAKRETMEEIGVEIEIQGLIGVYTGFGKNHYLNFVFSGKILNETPRANKDEINDFGWYSVDEIMKVPEHQILNPKKLKKILAAHRSGQLTPLGSIEENVYGN